MTCMRRSLPAFLGIVLSTSAINIAGAQIPVSQGTVSFPAKTEVGPGRTVRAELNIPSSGGERLPAVLILHSSGGVDGTGAFYASALNQAGIATLEIYMFAGGGRPGSTRITMPDAYGGLFFLANDPRIDPIRIGVMGFSWGGAMSMLTASEEVTRQYTGGKARFAAHLALYPVCWAHLNILSGKNSNYGPDTYRRYTGAPLHILAGDKDDYDDPDSCPKFVEALPDEVRRFVSVTIYRGASHGWDHPDGLTHTFHDAYAHSGRGGLVDTRADDVIAAQSREFATQFFANHLFPKG